MLDEDGRFLEAFAVMHKHATIKQYSKNTEGMPLLLGSTLQFLKIAILKNYEHSYC